MRRASYCTAWLALAIALAGCSDDATDPAGTASDERAATAQAATAEAGRRSSEQVLRAIAPIARDVIADNWNSATSDREHELQDRLASHRFHLVHSRQQMREAGPVYVDDQASTATSLVLRHRSPGGPLVTLRVRWRDDRSTTPFRLARAPLVVVTPHETTVYFRLNRAFSPGGTPVDVRLNAIIAPDAPPQDRGYVDERGGRCYATVFETPTAGRVGELNAVELVILDRPKARFRARVIGEFDGRVDLPPPHEAVFARLGC